jgi:ribonucleoside-diphosphate reductase alpha chain
MDQGWTLGHRDGANTHNVSATISIAKERKYPMPRISMEQEAKYWVDEWAMVGEWMWENKDFYNGISVLPYDGGSYTQAPFEEISEEEYLSRISSVKEIDLSKVMEKDDNVHFGQVAACAGGACEVS